MSLLVPILLAVAGAAIAAWLLHRKHQREKNLQQWLSSLDDKERARLNESQLRQQLSSLDAAERARREEDERRRAAIEQAQAQTTARQVLNGDPRIARHMLEQAGLDHRSLQDVSQDQEAVEEIARRIPLADLEMLRIASQQKELEFNLQRRNVRHEVNYPTADMEPVSMSSLDQMPSILPDQLLEDDEQFYSRLAQNEHLVLQSFENTDDQRLMYILLDVSGSMDGALANGFKRHVWARGVTVSLLLKAIDGQAKYFLRAFDGRPHELRQATTPAEAERLIKLIMTTGFSGGGTNIQSALNTAINDIRTKGGDISQSEVLLISDGESPVDIAQLHHDLGSDIRLHVMLLGHDGSELKRVAASFRCLQ